MKCEKIIKKREKTRKAIKKHLHFKKENSIIYVSFLQKKDEMKGDLYV